MTYDILATGSSGNAVVINGEILIDCGVPMKKLRESGYIKSLNLVLLTHAHGDHFNKSTVSRLSKERPSIRWGCCEWMVPHLLEAGVSERVIDLLTSNVASYYKNLQTFVTPVTLLHDVPNCGYKFRIFRPPGEKVFYATDTSTLDHIEAKNYDYYLIEANHTKAEIEARIADKLSRGEFSYEVRAARNHLSQEQALEWLARNAGPNSKVVFLHQHKDKDREVEDG